MLRDIVSSISSEIGSTYPVYADDTCLYICGASAGDLLKLSAETKETAKKVGYLITTVPTDKVRKIGRMSYRMR